MSSIKSETLTIDQIEVSPLNVRRHRADIEQLGAMEASILGRGLIQPLNVHPMNGSKKFGAFAGGRRTRSIKNLVKRGDLPGDWPVRVEVYRGHSDVELIELSLGENIQRRDLQDYETCAAVAALAKRGETPEQIAYALGQPLAIVRRWMRVGQLAAPIFETLSQGQLSIDAARAYAAAADHQLQLAAFEELRGLPDYLRTPEKIRAAMKVGDRQLLRRLRLVGDEAYRAAGGRFELDLFADEAEQRGRVVDEGLLATLVDDRLNEVRNATRVVTQRRDLRFVPKPPQTGYGSADETLRVNPRSRPGGGLIIPDGDVVGSIELSESGEPQVSYWWESRQAKHGTPAGRAETKASQPTPTGGSAIADPYHHAPVAKAQAREEFGTSADALYAVRTVRREMERAIGVEDAEAGGTICRSYLVWAQLRTLLTREPTGLRAPSPGDHEVGVSTDATTLARDRIEEQQAHSIWTAAVRRISAERWMTEPNHDDALVAFLHAPERDRSIAAAVLAGLLLERSAATPGYDFAAHRTLAENARGTNARSLRDVWAPTAEFLELFPKQQLLAIAADVVDGGSLAKWKSGKAAALPGLLSQALQGGGHAVPGRNRDRAVAWVHPLLSFTPPDGPEAAVDTAYTAIELAEAAE